MYDIGEFVVHNTHGVCRVESKQFNNEFQKEYYIFSSYSDDNLKIMLPADTIDDFIRPLSSKKSCIDILENVNELNKDYIKDNRLRKATYSKILISKDLFEIANLYSCLFQLSIDKKMENKSLGATDQKLFYDIKKKFLNELALVLDDSSENIETYLNDKLQHC